MSHTELIPLETGWSSFLSTKKTSSPSAFCLRNLGRFWCFFVVIFSKKPRVSHTSNLDLGAAPCLNPKKYVLRDQPRWLENGPGWKLDVFPIWKMGDIPAFAVLVYQGVRLILWEPWQKSSMNSLNWGKFICMQLYFLTTLNLPKLPRNSLNWGKYHPNIFQTNYFYFPRKTPINL